MVDLLEPETMASKQNEETEEEVGETLEKIPEHRRTWNSHDNTAHKTVIKEGALNQPRPRFGATGEISVTLNSVSGLEKDDLVKDPKLSKYFTGEANCEFEIGSATTAVDRAFETSLQSFLPGEISHLIFNVFIENNFNEKSKTILEPFWVTVDCEVSLKSLLNADPIYKWYPETKLNKAKEMYLEGVELFKLGRYLDSFHFFQWAHKLSVFTIGLQKTEKQPGDDTDPAIVAEALKYQLNCSNNLAACHFQWNNFKNVVELSNKVLAKEPSMVKALYRRGVSYLGLNEFELAEKDLVAAHKVDPTNRAVNEKLGQVKQKKKANQTEMSKNLSKMFG
eukprot:TRINITY_DN16084_c0_g1_i1.p1 TRINITY_DN16084_c0_g1~~TRINITY_DN16084_c0_g1_i1.p1  ORF type:complete len:337 (-),score=103.06 TRINITY_DN16084_c0_g1_i1:8-1018(-)